MTPRSILRTALLATAATLALSACKDKAGADVEAVEALSVKGLSDADIAKHFEVPACTATDAQMEAGLAALALDTESDTVSWGSRDMEDGGYEFDDVTITTDGNVATVGELDMTCLREVNGVVQIDRASAEDIELTSPDGTVTIASFTVMEPDVADVRAFLSGSTDVNVPDARAFALDDLVVTGGTGTERAEDKLELESLAFARAMDDSVRDGFIRVGEFDFDGGTDTTESISIDFEGATITGIASTGMLTSGMGAIGTQAMGPFASPYDSLEIGAFDVDVDTLSLSGAGAVGQNTVRGDLTDMVSVLEPVTLAFSAEPTDGDVKGLYDAMAGMGYDSVTISARSEAAYDQEEDRMIANGGFFEWEDGFRLVIDSDVSGLSGMQEAAARGDDPTAALDDLRINGMIVRLEDNSIVDRVFAAAAADQDTTPKMLRMQAKGLLAMGTMGAGQFGVDPDIVAEAVSALGEFIDSPESTLVMELNPIAPVGINDVMAGTKDDLGFAARVEK